MTNHKFQKALLPEAQERVEAVIAAHAGRHVVEVSGRQFVVHEHVFDPTIAPSGSIGMCFAALPNVRGKIVADIGAGSGIFSCLFALNGARKVISTDVSDGAIANVRENVARYSLQDTVDIRQGQGFRPFSKDDGIEIAYCDFPFADWRPPETDLDAAFFDIGLGAISEVLSDLSTRSELANVTLYLCTSSLSERWQDNIAFSRNLEKAKVLTLTEDWVGLQLWRITRWS